MAGLLRWQHPSWYQWENSIYQLKMIKPKGRDRLSPKSHHWVAILSSEPSTPGLLVVWDSWSPLFFQPVLVVGSVTGCQTCSLWSRDLLKTLHFFSFYFLLEMTWTAVVYYLKSKLGGFCLSLPLDSNTTFCDSDSDTTKKFSNTSWVSYTSAQFWYYLLGDSIIANRLRAQSYKTTPNPILLDLHQKPRLLPIDWDCRFQ